MNKKNKLIVVAVVLLILIVVTIFWSSDGTVIIDKDTTINNNFTIAHNKTVILKNSAKLTVVGDMTIDGTLSCENGMLPLAVRDSINVTGKIDCMLTDTAPIQHGTAIAISAKHFSFNKSAELNTNGHIDMVTNAEKLLSTDDARSRVYTETGEDTGTSPRVGPFKEGRPTQALSMNIQNSPRRHGSSHAQTSKNLSKNRFINIAEASSPSDNLPSMIIGGTWTIGDKKILTSGLSIPIPPKNTKDLLLYLDVGDGGMVTLNNLHVIGSSGRDGADDIKKDCTARGKDGENAFRMRVSAGSVELNNFQLDLGGGGKGGDAETTKDCTNAIAQGGKGGEAANFKITGAEYIHILNLTITPGKGGNGGNASAFARNGENSCPGGNGGDASATGGGGANSKKELATAGSITGLESVKTGRIVGGSGGNALATPGNGGNGTECGCTGGKGGGSNALGGKGGDAFAIVPIGTIEGHGGDGGSVDTRGGVGGNGGSCPFKQSGGDGGVGGAALAVPGTAGKGLTANGNKGAIKNQGGGDGGAGGDGCNPGLGGQGGMGAPIGTFGPLGKNLCVDGTQVIPPQETSPALIRAVLYKGSYLPVDQLVIENEAGCGVEHWHAAQDTVKATNGKMIPDPGPLCGFGKVKDNQPDMVPKNTVSEKLVPIRIQY
jgi:hypothetical protein